MNTVTFTDEENQQLIDMLNDVIRYHSILARELDASVARDDPRFDDTFKEDVHASLSKHAKVVLTATQLLNVICHVPIFTRGKE